MELKQLEYFVAVAEERNFTRAAERVHISQSGVSAQIRRLERELGAELFDRSSRVVTLTVAGKAALDHARAALAATGALGQAVAEVGEVIRGHLTIGMVIGCTITPLFDALAAFHRSHPGVELSLLEGNSALLVDDVRAGSLDLALTGAAELPSDLYNLTIISEPLVAVIPPGHPLAALPDLRLRDLVQHPLVCLPPGTGVRTVFDRACADQGLRPRIALQASAGDAIADLAARNLAVAVLATSMADRYQDSLIARPITDAAAPTLLALLWKNTHNPALRELIVHCRRSFNLSGGLPGTVPPAH
ncbi:MAG TPA: LysR substrate-binding domain-containing protein [Pseudonocardiaceae bacterium]|jgi:DNA-binding transcriptional LysR family regulator|nr:LysR substrate-binding domain-containing protein [Pseudonocardiaceae bacterium]